MSDNAWMLICNTFKLACFAGLAMYFNRWWIVFFVVIFLTYKKIEVRKNDRFHAG